MKLSKEHELLVVKIRDGEISSLSDYIVNAIGLEDVFNDGYIRTENGCTFVPEKRILRVEDEAEVALRLHRFIALCNRLCSFGLIEKVNSVPSEIPALVTVGDLGLYKYVQNCHDIWSANSGFTIVPTHELSVFVENNFMTDDELEREERRGELQGEKIARKRSELITIVIAIMSMIVSVVLAYFNYKTYSNERRVYVENFSKFKSPIEVKVVDGFDDKLIRKKPSEDNKNPH